tara:strand:+ start:1080 stop:2207 length:1128 start_codon:yes stop_codon:yes gene_type:complete
MKKMKVMTVVGTRPEIIRLSRVIPKLDEYCDHIFVHTGQNYDYELNEIFFEELGIRKPDYFLNIATGKASQTIGNIIIEIDKLIEKHKPESFLVLGDTNSCLSAYSAKRRKVPIFHMEAGNRCFDQRVPEEVNRKLIDHLADINLTYSSISREYLISEGIDPVTVIKTGSPMKEVLDHNQKKIQESKILDSLGLKKLKYFLVSVHREENIDNDHNLKLICEILNQVSSKYGLNVIVSTHPRTRARIEEKNIKFHENITLLKPLGFIDYVNLQLNSKVVISDSGTITEESSILNFPAINLREVNERPEGFEEGAVMMTGIELSRVMQAIEILENQPRNNERLLNIVDDYSSNNVSHKVLRILHSYTGYIDNFVWRK